MLFFCSSQYRILSWGTPTFKPNSVYRIPLSGIGYESLSKDGLLCKPPTPGLSMSIRVLLCKTMLLAKQVPLAPELFLCNFGTKTSTNCFELFSSKIIGSCPTKKTCFGIKLIPLYKIPSQRTSFSVSLQFHLIKFFLVVSVGTFSSF